MKMFPVYIYGLHQLCVFVYLDDIIIVGLLFSIQDYFDWFVLLIRKVGIAHTIKYKSYLHCVYF